MGNCVIINNNLTQILYYLANVTNTIPSNRYITNLTNQSCLDVFSRSKAQNARLLNLDHPSSSQIFSNKKKAHRECKLGRTERKYRRSKKKKEMKVNA